MDDALIMKFAGALIAVLNPIGALPVFLAMTDGAGAAAQQRIAMQVGLCLVLLGTVAALAGVAILAFFGISIRDLQVAGGLVVLKLAFGMLSGATDAPRHGAEGRPTGQAAGGAVAFYPLAFPLLMGPGGITTMIIFAGRVRGSEDWFAYFAAFGAVVASVVAIFALGSRFGTFLSSTARVIMSRLMGMILAAIAVQMIAEGVKALLPGLARVG